MSFWKLSEGSLDKTATTFEAGGGAEPIPDNTNLKACIDEVLWENWQGESHIKARWTVLDGDYKGRKVFQKIRVEDQDPKKRDKAIRMLAAIDANAGGKLLAYDGMPDDELLQQALCNKPMIIKVQVWEINGKSGNWVSMVAGLQPKTPKPSADFDEDIPF